ncbi:MAG TPA: 50S ribosomal protein L23 [Candidatus Binatia bacterium]|nr:50S ribosomal protein L23 [Candidatus Binatia bacterium]
MSQGRAFHQVILRPISSEKSYSAMGRLNKYTFACAPRVTKIEIRRAIEEAFPEQELIVTAVNVVTIHGKVRNRQYRRGRGNRLSGRSPSWKKAVITLAPGQKIPGLFEGV